MPRGFMPSSVPGAVRALEREIPQKVEDLVLLDFARVPSPAIRS
jgi:hypothetical protein